MVMSSVVNDPVADIVSDVVATTRRGSLMYSRNRFHAPWGAAFPAGNLANFHVITTGACWLTFDGADPVQLTRGDVVLIPSGAAHELADTPGRPTRPMPEIAGRTLDDGAPPSDVVIDGDGPATVWICGGYRLAAGVRHPLTSVLPDVVVITAAEARGTGLGAAVDLIAAEVDGTDPGRAWTLDTLARATQTPRATLTRRFAALTGQSPIAYLTAWRMSLAARRLRDGDATVRQIAHELGYDSEFAFARAFKRATGSAPGQHRKLAQTTGRRRATAH